MKEKKLGIVLFIGQLLIFVSYYLILLEQQLKNNISRLEWIRNETNDPITGLSLHLIGVVIDNTLAWIPTILFLLFIFIYFYHSRKGAKKNIEIYIIITSIILFIFSYLSRSFVRPRYAVVLYLLLSIIAGWGISFLVKKKDTFAFTIIFAYLVFDFSILGATLIRVQKTMRFMQTRFGEFASEDKSLILSNHPVSPFVYKQSLFSNQLVPESIYKQGIYDVKNLSFEQLAFTGKPTKDYTHTEIKEVLKTFGMNKVIFLDKGVANHFNDDPKLINVLKDSCNMHEHIADLYYMFTECKF